MNPEHVVEPDGARQAFEEGAAARQELRDERGWDTLRRYHDRLPIERRFELLARAGIHDTSSQTGAPFTLALVAVAPLAIVDPDPHRHAEHLWELACWFLHGWYDDTDPPDRPS